VLKNFGYRAPMIWSVLIVDDSLLVLEGVKQLLETESDFKVVGEATDGIEAIEKAIKLKPHLIILDFSMPALNGLGVAPLLRERLPEVTIIMLTMFSGGQLEAAARSAGAHALVAKQDTPKLLIPTARAILNMKAMPDAQSSAA
jgi:DNA-binding NarL/FixJ family response regulator